MKTFIEYFDSTVDRFSARPAIVEHGVEKFNYGALRGAARALAARLIAQGVSRGDIVGIAISKSADYVVSLLAIWYAGAAFVPLEPALPLDRVSFMCQDAAVRLVIVNSEEQKSLFAGLEIAVVEIGDDVSADVETVDLPGRSTALADSAYVIFTSGTTGKPKGVLVTHQGIVSFLSAQIEAFQIDENTRSLWYLSTSFDASVSDLGTALLSGAALCIEDSERIQPGAGLESLLAERAITFVDIPPSMLRLMSPELLPDCLKSICIGGEACALDVVRAYAARLNLVNVYGPTEATVCTSLGRCRESWSQPLIGQPLPGINYKILDDELRPVAAGTPGQLHIGGIGLAAGYLNRPELTAAKFIELNGERLYRTGDLVMLNNDGEYQFIGRCDRQFKLRGMLIEPEEIEAQLLNHSDVERAAVLKRPVKPGVAREILVAFVSLKNERSTAQLLDFLAGALPKWMIPQRLEFIDSMPLTVTGKIDYSTLRKCALSVRELEIGPDKSGNGHIDNGHIDNVLVEVYKQVLGVDDVKIDDHFYELGGDSFAVVEACVVASALGLDVPPALFMNYPVIADLAEQLQLINDNSDSTGGRAGANLATAAGGMAAADILSDIGLPPDIAELVTAREKPAKPAGRARQIFLTGATGFLGARLLHEILTFEDAVVHCLVRAENESAGISRLKQALAKHGLSDALSASALKRVKVICGALEERQFGLSDATFSTLSATIDTVYHCAARVNNLASYQELRSVNVEGTLEVARLMLNGRPKNLHYISTLSVFVATDQNHGRLLESDHLADTGVVYGGYAQTKWAAEKLLRSIENSLGSVTYHRLGLITGDTVSGKSAEHDFLNLFIDGIVSLGCAPHLAENIAVDITPVDFAARAVVRLAQHSAADQTCTSATYHIANSESLSLPSLLANLQRAGATVEIVSPDAFRQKLLSRVSLLGGAESAACLALCRTAGANFDSFRTMDLFQATDVIFDSREADSILRPLGVVCPRPSDELIQLYLAAMLAA